MCNDNCSCYHFKHRDLHSGVQKFYWPKQVKSDLKRHRKNYRSKRTGKNSQTVRTAAETAAVADLIKVDQNNTLHNNLERVQTQPEDIRDQLAGELPFIIVSTVRA